MKRLIAQGSGVVVKEADAFTEDQVKKLWNLKLLGDHSPQVLLDTMMFMIWRNFSLRSGKEHRNLQFQLLTLVEARATEPEKPLYNSFSEKSNQGDLKHLSLKPK